DFTPPGASTPQWVSLTSKPEGPRTATEAAARLVQVANLKYQRANGLTGVSAATGGPDGQDFTAHVDLHGGGLGDMDFDGDHVDNAGLDLTADLVLRPLPATLSVCLREPGDDLRDASDNPVTQPCEDNAAFPVDLSRAPGDDNVVKLSRTPLSLG